MATQNFSLSHAREKTENIFLYPIFFFNLTIMMMRKVSLLLQVIHVNVFKARKGDTFSLNLFSLRWRKPEMTS